MLWYLGKSSKSVISKEGWEMVQRLGLRNGTGLDVIAGKRGRDELGLHQELWLGMLKAQLRLCSKQRLLWAEVEHTPIAGSAIWRVRIDGNPIFRIVTRVHCGPRKSRIFDLTRPSFRFRTIVRRCRGGLANGQCASGGY